MERGSAARHCHLVVVEDDAPLRELLGEVLADEGHRVTTLDAPPPPNRLAALGPDLVILDLDFGHGAGGLGLLGEVRADAALSRLPVVVCSAVPFLAERAEAEPLLAGCTLVAKPFDLDRLLTAVAEGLGGAKWGTARVSSPADQPRCRDGGPSEGTSAWAAR